MGRRPQGAASVPPLRCRRRGALRVLAPVLAPILSRVGRKQEDRIWSELERALER